MTERFQLLLLTVILVSPTLAIADKHGSDKVVPGYPTKSVPGFKKPCNSLPNITQYSYTDYSINFPREAMAYFDGWSPADYADAAALAAACIKHGYPDLAPKTRVEIIRGAQDYMLEHQAIPALRAHLMATATSGGTTEAEDNAVYGYSKSFELINGNDLYFGCPAAKTFQKPEYINKKNLRYFREITAESVPFFSKSADMCVSNGLLSKEQATAYKADIAGTYEMITTYQAKDEAGKQADDAIPVKIDHIHMIHPDTFVGQSGRIKVCRMPGVFSSTDRQTLDIPPSTYTGAQDEEGRSRSFEISAEEGAVGPKGSKHACVELNAKIIHGDDQPIKKGQKMEAQWSIPGLEVVTTALTDFK